MTSRAQGLGRAKYSVQLAEEEKHWGGHGVRDHVAISRADLIAALSATAEQSPDGGTIMRQEGEGSYNSIYDANNLVNRILERNPAACDLVASGQWDETWLNVRFGYPTGYEAYVTATADIAVRPTYNAGVLIVHDERVPRGYRVKTTYPNNKNVAND